MNTVVLPGRLDSGRIQAVNQTVRRTFVVNVEHGLHARPCALLVKTVHPYRASVEVEVDGNMASAKSILGLMGLGAGYGSEMTFTIVGDDSLQAMAAVDHLFATRFEDAYRAPALVIQR